MAASYYPLFGTRLLNPNYDAGSGVDLVGDDIRFVILDSGYTRNIAHDFLNDLVTASNSPASGGTATLTGEAVLTNTSFDSDDATHTSVTTGETITQGVLYKHTGTDTTSVLIAHYDGFSQLTNGGNLTALVNASGWLTIVPNA
jgi:hypothetical protein